MTVFRSASLRARLVPGLILLLLLGQGLRLCIHAASVSGETGHPVAVAAPLHLEGNLSSSDDASDGVVDRDVTLSLALMNLLFDLASAVILTALVVFLLPQPGVSLHPRVDFHPRPGVIAGLRPPLRAPPR